MPQLFLMLCSIVASSVTTTGGSTEHLPWQSHYGQAKRNAQAAKRPLVVVIENSDNIQLKDSEIAGEPRKKLASRQYELVRVDARTDYGRRVAKAFGAQEFPYIAVTDKVSKRIVFRKAGQMTQADWTLALAKSEQIVAESKTNARARVVVGPSSSGGEVIVGSSSPAIARPVVVHDSGSVITQPSYQPIVTPQMFAPAGVYQLPASQCLT